MIFRRCSISLERRSSGSIPSAAAKAAVEAAEATQAAAATLESIFSPVYREGLVCVAVADRLVALRTVLLFCPPISWSAVCADRC